ncbi:TetR/AcrR family transcriptional regulator [Sphingobium sp.]|uniref:TetR/AcrR family transcriptional regulator n=1 Tax=Sphingobium sp. TaxID=1912891 RepID=UPI0028BED929|nr:TetR/AcrR family transcriptional regulator [Sphingobium sp.]
MGRRSDHNREELEALILAEGHRHMAEAGFAKFSSREVAKRIGYSVGTLYNVFGSYDRLIVAINTRTFHLWAAYLEHCLASNPKDGRESRPETRIAALVEGYFSFARENTNIWMAIYDHRLPPGIPMPEDYARQRAVLTEVVVREVAAALPPESGAIAPRLARSLVATVHGHCTFALNGSFALLGETDPLEMATARVRESLRAAGARL